MIGNVFKDSQHVRSCLHREHWKYINNNIIPTGNITSKIKLLWYYIKGNGRIKQALVC